ncbi:MAG: glycerol kinase [Acidimicrobiales bacterium]|nr:glycerol kinase [Acidimicrobiales bacterium]
MNLLVIDVGTSSVRAAVVSPEGEVVAERRQPTPPATPFPGLVEVDATALATAALDCARGVLDAAGPVEAVGVTNQRATTIVWDATTGEPVGPGLGWQDLRTVGDCLVLQADGFRLAPNQSATKLANLLDAHDPDRSRNLRFGTVDSWVVWQLTEGAVHVTDASNAGVTGLTLGSAPQWDPAICDRLRIVSGTLPAIVDSSGVVAPATALPGAPVIAGIAGDQQASLIGQGCVSPGGAKITFGTGGMLDVCVGPHRPEFAVRSDHGSFPIIAWQRDGQVTWGVEAIMLAAGTNIDWLVEDLGILSDAAASHEVASACTDTEGVVYVPALLGLGTPQWDFGARGALFGLTRGSGRPHIVRAVLEGVAQRGADLVDAVEADTGLRLDTVRVDGGMSVNPTFVQALANATGRRVERCATTEGTTLGAAYLAGLAVGTWADWHDIAELWRPAEVIEPTGSLDRDRWRDAVTRAANWHPDLSALSF